MPSKIYAAKWRSVAGWLITGHPIRLAGTSGQRFVLIFFIVEMILTGSLAAVLVLRHVEPPAEHPEVSAVIDVNSQHVECS